MKKAPEVAAEYEKIYKEVIDLMTRPKPFLYKVTFHNENKKDIQKAIDWINNNGGKLDAQFFRVPHDFIEMEIR
jgi:DNA topoisomerase IA